jgi:MFS family permease
VVTPSLIMITSGWYKRQEGALRFGIWFSGLGLGQIIGGLVSFAAQHSRIGFQGWRVMFLIVGLINVVLSLFIYTLPPSPAESDFLTAQEKSHLIQRLKEDHAGTGIKVIRPRSVLEAFVDLQTWMLCLITILSTMSAGVVVYFSATIIKNFGYDSKEAALLNMPSGIVATTTVLGLTFLVYRGYDRWFGMLVGCGICTTGACLIAFLPSNQKIGLLVGVYLVNAVSWSCTCIQT